MSRILRHVGNKDFRRTRQRQIGEQKELAAQKLKEWKESEAERKQIEEIARPLKSNWREETQLQENDWTPVAGSIANSSAQTFHYRSPNFETGEPNAITVSGLGGVESVPSTTTIDSGFGETENVSGPNYSQLGLQGYAPPLGGVQRQTQQSENERIDAEIRKLEAQIKESKAKETAAIEAWNAELIATMDRHQREWDAVLKKDEVYNPEKHKGLQARHGAEMDAIWNKEPKTEPYETERQNLRTKIFDLENQRPINQQLDASQQAYPNLPMMGARVQSAVGTNTKESIIPPQPTDDLLDRLADKFGAGDAKDVFDDYMKWVKNPNSNPVNMTDRIGAEGRDYLQKLAGDPSVQGLTGVRKAAALNLLYQKDLDNNKIPRGIRNTLGMPDFAKGDGFTVGKDGTTTFSKAYDFTDHTDFAGADPITGLPAMAYAISQGGLGIFGKKTVPVGASGARKSTKILPSPTMNILVNVSVPRRKKKKKKEEELGESTWSRLKKHR